MLVWAGYVLIKLIGPMLAPSDAPREPKNWRTIYLTGTVLIALFLIDQLLLGRFG